MFFLNTPAEDVDFYDESSDRYLNLKPQTYPMQTEQYPSGKLVFKEGDTGNKAYRIVKGSVEVSIQEEGHRVVLAMLAEDEIFGEMAMIEQRPRSATVRATEELTVEVINREDFHVTLQNGGDHLMPYLSTIFERLRVTNGRLHSALAQLEENGLNADAHFEEAPVAEDGPCLEIAPDSEETRSQTVLQARQIRQFPFVIGRRSEIAGVGVYSNNQLLIADRAPYRVSRNHCMIDHDSDTFVLRDYGSRLGSILNGVGVGGPHAERSLPLLEGENLLILGGSDSQIRFKLVV